MMPMPASQTIARLVIKVRILLPLLLPIAAHFGFTSYPRSAAASENTHDADAASAGSKR
jgi:hypothetical protein